jgi:hypothetical protein
MENEKLLLYGGIVACIVVIVWSFVQMMSCDAACEQRRIAAKIRNLPPAPPPPPPLPAHSNVSSECPGVVVAASENPGRFRKFPTAGLRSDWMGDQHTNPCAVYYQIFDGTLVFAADYGFGTSGWEEMPNSRQSWPVRIDLVASKNATVRWQYILCREWHPVMKEWRCR